MRYKGQGNPLAVLVSCLTLGWLPLILLVLFLLWIPLWVYGIAACVALLVWMMVEFDKENANEK